MKFKKYLILCYVSINLRLQNYLFSKNSEYCCKKNSEYCCKIKPLLNQLTCLNYIDPVPSIFSILS